MTFTLGSETVLIIRMFQGCCDRLYSLRPILHTHTQLHTHTYTQHPPPPSHRPQQAEQGISDCASQQLTRAFGVAVAHET